jgi:ribosomal protein S18 acetylase RimI-like enzyme
LTIRDMSLADCAALAALRDEPTLGIAPESELAGHLTRAWVAVLPDGAPLGYLLGWWVVDELEVLALGVLPAARRKGVGRALLEHALAVTRAGGGRRVTLEVGRGNAAARRLYEAAGFSVFNVRTGYYRATGEDALEMEHVVGQDAGPA